MRSMRKRKTISVYLRWRNMGLRAERWDQVLAHKRLRYYLPEIYANFPYHLYYNRMQKMKHKLIRTWNVWHVSFHWIFLEHESFRNTEARWKINVFTHVRHVVPVWFTKWLSEKRQQHIKAKEMCNIFQRKAVTLSLCFSWPIHDGG